MRRGIAVGLAVVALLMFSQADALAQQGKTKKGKTGLKQDPIDPNLPPLIRSILEYRRRMDARMKEMGAGSSSTAVSESVGGKTRTYRRRRQGRKITEEGDKGLAGRADRLRQDLEELARIAPLTISITVDGKSCTAVVKHGNLQSVKGDRSLLDKYVMDEYGMIREFESGRLAPSASVNISSSVPETGTKNKQPPTKKPAPPKEDDVT